MVLIIWEQHNLKRLFSCHQEKGETALHLAVLLADRTSLHILDFLAQNWSVCYGNLCYTSVCVCVCTFVFTCMFFFFFFVSSNVDTQTSAGNTALHYSCLHNKTDCVKLLLRARANTHISNTHTHTCIMYLSELSFISWASTVCRGYLMSFW